jgi:diaminopimelate decarboxylase
MIGRVLQSVRRVLLERSYAAQRSGAARDLALWDLRLNDKGHMSIGGLDAIDLLDQFGSPLLVVHHDTLIHHAADMIRALSIAPDGSKVFYSYKTNCIPGVLMELHALGIGAEVISPYELWLAHRLGVPGGSIIYNGVAKTDESLELAIRMGVAAINIDDLSEIERIAQVAERRGERARVGVRLGLLDKAQFGLGVGNGESLEACRRIMARPDCFDFRCVHFNVTSNSKASGDHRGALLQSLGFLSELKRTLAVDVPLLDIGGGFGVPTTKNLSGMEYLLYRGLGVAPAPPDPSEAQPIDAYLADLVGEVRKAAAANGFRVPAIAVEPGRFITSRAEMLLTRINSIKTRSAGSSMVITDAGRLSVTFPCDFEYHEVFVANRPLAPLEHPYMVTGRVCTSSDWLVRNRLLPRLQAHDALAVMDAGAYFSSYSSNFAFPRPAIVMVRDGTARVIRRAESFEHLVAMDDPSVVRSLRAAAQNHDEG